MASYFAEEIRQAVIADGFNKVINDVADGFKRCGFFNRPDWKNLLLHGFERKKLGFEIQFNTTVHTSVMSDDSFERGLTAQSTPLVAARTAPKGILMSRNKRRCTLLDDDLQRAGQQSFKRAKGSVDEVEAARILLDLRSTDWERILPDVNEVQNTVQYDNVFDKSRQLRGLMTPVRTKPAGNVAVSQTTTSSRAQNQPTASNAIKNRRNAIYIPSAKRPIPVPKAQQQPMPVTQHVSSGSKNANPALTPAGPADNAVLTNITNRRMTRKQTRLLAAYSGTGSDLALTSTKVAERRGTVYFQRSTVLFTMVDAAQYKDILPKYNIFVADMNEKYDYVITDRIYRSAKFLSAVVSGKPILSVKWLHALDDKKIWLDPLNYLLKDDKGEKEYGFDLSATLLKATDKRLFENYSVLVTPHTSIAPDCLKGVIFSGGGKFLKTSLVPRRGDEVICISDAVDKKMWPTLQRKYPTLKKIISLDGFSKMIFRFTHDVSPADILHQI